MKWVVVLAQKRVEVRGGVFMEGVFGGVETVTLEADDMTVAESGALLFAQYLEPGNPLGGRRIFRAFAPGTWTELLVDG